MKKKLLVGLATSVMILAILGSANALTIDTNSQWDSQAHHVNTGWLGSGQSLTVDSVDNHFDSIGFYFDSASTGLTFDFIVSNAMNNGSTLFSTSFTVTSGINIINIDRDMVANSNIYTLIDYKGFTGATAHFMNSDVYTGGNSSFGAFDHQSEYATLDHRFIAEFSDSAPVPEPATFLLLGSGLAGLAFYRRKRK